jgi:hypothetical protein
MLQLYKYKGGTFCRYTVSAQTHCAAIDVEKWIQESADKDGAIHNVSVEIHGHSIPLSHAAEAYVVAALYAADHNDYVARNLNYPLEASSEDDSVHDCDNNSLSSRDTEEAMHDLTLDPDFEQNEDCIENDFGPSNAWNTYHSWLNSR